MVLTSCDIKDKLSLLLSSLLMMGMWYSSDAFFLYFLLLTLPHVLVVLGLSWLMNLVHYMVDVEVYNLLPWVPLEKVVVDLLSWLFFFDG